MIRRLTNVGVFGGSDIIQRRRIRILNIFNLIAAAIILTYFVVNCIIGTIGQAFTIMSGLFVLTVPVFYFHSRQWIHTAKIYFVLVTILFINLMAYKTLFQFPDRDNDFIMIGFSTLIIVLFDNPRKLLFFCLNAALAVSLKIIRIAMYQPDTLVADNFLSIMNMLMAFVCVYFFTDVYKVDLLRSDMRIRSFAKNVERQKEQINIEKDKLVYNKYLLRTTIDNLPIFIALLDKTGHYIIVNNRFNEVILKDVEGIEGKHYTEVLGTEISEMAAPLFNRCLEGFETDIDGPVTFLNGERIHAYGKYIPLKNHYGKVSRVLTYVTDISEVKETENQLIIANASKDKVLSILSHDLRSPLVSLGGLLAYADDIEPKKFKELMGTVKQQVDTISFTLDNVLTWVKSQLGAFVATPKDVNLEYAAKRVVELYSESVKGKAIRVENKIPKDLQVFFDPDHLAIVIRNLMSNAIKFTPQDGGIVLSAKSENRTTSLSVCDSGIGMCDDTIVSVLEGINKNKASTRLGTNGEKGTGLGLNFCLDILSLNNGSMEIKSEPDHGTEITVILPTA
ncbi:ATP-binding protein [Reichenbachiella sp.]|uniref:sensor histidine kinase n=1 Tax=Reichenbachiella sp. TaxID=2184521 RepID=UPI003BAF6DC2